MFNLIKSLYNMFDDIDPFTGNLFFLLFPGRNLTLEHLYKTLYFPDPSQFSSCSCLCPMSILDWPGLKEVF